MVLLVGIGVLLRIGSVYFMSMRDILWYVSVSTRVHSFYKDVSQSIEISGHNVLYLVLGGFISSLLVVSCFYASWCSKDKSRIPITVTEAAKFHFRMASNPSTSRK